MIKNLLARTLLLVSLLSVGGAAQADEYQGADAILKQIDALAQASADPSAKPSESRLLREALAAFKARSAALPPEQAAREWLDLFDRTAKLSGSRQPGPDMANGALSFQETIAALPPPAAWDALNQQIQTRPLPAEGKQVIAARVLRLIAATLQNQEPAAWAALGELEKQASALSSNNPRNSYSFMQVRQKLMAVSSPQRALDEFEHQLARFQDADKDKAPDIGDQENGNALEVPDLVAIADAGRAEAVLRRLFSLPLKAVSFSSAGERTTSLARRVATEMAGGLKFTPWALAQDINAVDFFEMLKKQFGVPTEGSNNNDYRQAVSYYLLGLVVKGRSEEAATLATKMGQDANSRDESMLNLRDYGLEDLAQQGYAKEAANFLAQLLRTHPNLPFWKDYIDSAALAGDSDAMLNFVREQMDRPNLPAHTRQTLREAYGAALLAADRIPQGVQIMRDMLASQASGNSNERENWLTALATIGALLKDDSLIKESLDGIMAQASLSDENHPLTWVTGDSHLTEIFLTAGRGPELERIYLAAFLAAERQALALRRSRVPGQSVMSGLDEGYYSRSAFSRSVSPLKQLVAFYHLAGRYQDVVDLLDHAKNWGVDDLAELIATDTAYRSSGQIGYMAAHAFRQTGKPAEALAALNVFFNYNGGYDPAYALLLELLPAAEAEKRLDELFQHDRFEERPLIWKAQLQLQQNRLDEAEKTARQAIAIDPSDGEEGRGDRMRVYAVLGDILARKGDAAESERMKQAVKAIRLSEEADRYHSAGLLSRAVAMYKQALDYFADAYCVQSRLAIQLAALGRMDEAEAHYTRAYELMPDSFGRMESHCFGCEGAFRGEVARNAAERVFQKLVVKQPFKPQVHYLLGYLREEESRRQEAAQSYRQAVRLDPDYLNAWKHLADQTLQPEDRNAAAVNLLRLDPRQEHGGNSDWENMTDLRALWQATETAAKFQTPKPANFYPLAASKAALAEAKPQRQKIPGGGDASQQVLRRQFYYNGMGGYYAESETNAFPWPGEAITITSVISAALQALDQSAVLIGNE